MMAFFSFIMIGLSLTTVIFLEKEKKENNLAVMAEIEFLMEQFTNYIRIFTILFAIQIIMPTKGICGFTITGLLVVAAGISALLNSIKSM